MELEQDDVILFQGDSITDCGRNCEGAPELGFGYAYITSCILKAQFPTLNLTCINRGISGNRVKDLEARWQEDCIDLKPTILSVLIGVNDTWRRYDNNDETPVEEYEACYRRILQRAKDELGCRIVIMEPFLLHCPEDRAAWREDLDPKIQAARRIAVDFADVFVALDGPLTQAAIDTGASYWLPDGVHPNEQCRALIASHWLEAVGVSS